MIRWIGWCAGQKVSSLAKLSNYMHVYATEPQILPHRPGPTGAKKLQARQYRLRMRKITYIDYRNIKFLRADGIGTEC